MLWANCCCTFPPARTVNDKDVIMHDRRSGNVSGLLRVPTLRYVPHRPLLARLRNSQCGVSLQGSKEEPEGAETCRRRCVLQIGRLEWKKRSEEHTSELQ